MALTAIKSSSSMPSLDLEIVGSWSWCYII